MSSGSESDEDYVPGKPEKLSGEESADDETEKQYENEVEIKSKKRKIADDAKGKKKRKSKRTTNIGKETKEEEVEPVEKSDEEEFNPEEQKKKEDDLWAMFLDGTDTKPKSKETTSCKQTTSSQPLLSVAKKPEVKDAKADDAKEKERRIFEFAGETIVVENNVIKERVKTGESPATVSKLPSRASTGSGLSGLIGQLNKKNKLSTLEKSKLDWTTYKKEEGIEEEINSHNKGKNGFLDRRDFLERADVRQYEIERELRLNKRSNR